MLPDRLRTLAEKVLRRYGAEDRTVATAESCTGGLIAGTLTAISGSSSVVECGFVTYSNEAKTRMLGVAMTLIEEHGAVSEAVARAMAAGALSRSRADCAVAVTGIAGPGGGTAEKPVGLVYIACQERERETVVARMAFGDIGRDAVREETVVKALEMLLDQPIP